MTTGTDTTPLTTPAPTDSVPDARAVTAATDGASTLKTQAPAPAGSGSVAVPDAGTVRGPAESAPAPAESALASAPAGSVPEAGNAVAGGASALKAPAPASAQARLGSGPVAVPDAGTARGTAESAAGTAESVPAAGHAEPAPAAAPALKAPAPAGKASAGADTDTDAARGPDPVPAAPAAPARAGTAALAVVRVLKAVAVRSAAILALVALWEFAPRAGLVDATFLPPISEVAVAWWELAGDGQLADHTQASLIRSFGGFGIAVAVAVPLGLLIGWYRPLADFLGPLLEVFRNTAALALLPVFVLLLGIGETSKVSIVVYACLWPVLLNTISAVRNADPTLVRLARSMDLSTPRLFQKVILPASVPAIFTGIRLAGAVSILVLVAAEMIGAKAGLGYLINASQFNFAIPQMYAGIVTISAIGVAFNQLLVTIERRLSTWRVPA
ncbi:ABC transporter permease subunit [Streptomyces sp. NPDC060020]|uniref:ABC transporter permease n=1 Tax=Streptomyces sp. NPDC060020 TaxID=3347038 RepID=UPI003680EF82